MTGPRLPREPRGGAVHDRAHEREVATVLDLFHDPRFAGLCRLPAGLLGLLASLPAARHERPPFVLPSTSPGTLPAFRGHVPSLGQKATLVPEEQTGGATYVKL